MKGAWLLAAAAAFGCEPSLEPAASGPEGLEGVDGDAVELATPEEIATLTGQDGAVVERIEKDGYVVEFRAAAVESGPSYIVTAKGPIDVPHPIDAVRVGANVPPTSAEIFRAIAGRDSSVLLTAHAIEARRLLRSNDYRRVVPASLPPYGATPEATAEGEGEVEKQVASYAVAFGSHPSDFTLLPEIVSHEWIFVEVTSANYDCNFDDPRAPCDPNRVPDVYTMAVCTGRARGRIERELPNEDTCATHDAGWIRVGMVNLGSAPELLTDSIVQQFYGPTVDARWSSFPQVIASPGEFLTADWDVPEAKAMALASTAPTNSRMVMRAVTAINVPNQ